MSKRYFAIQKRQLEAKRNRTLAESYEQRVKDMDEFLQKTSSNLQEFDDELVRKLIENIKVISADEYDEKIKEKEEEMVALIAENARADSYIGEFDERYREIAEEINTLKEE